jgi:hypothetical protein
MASTSRQAPVRTKLWKGAYHAYEDRGPTQVFHGYHIGYNAEAAEGTIKAVININTLKTKKPNNEPRLSGGQPKPDLTRIDGHSLDHLPLL